MNYYEILGITRECEFAALKKAYYRRARECHPDRFGNAPEKAEEVTNGLEKRVRDLLSDHPEWQRKLLLLTNDTPTIGILRGKYRRQLLMKTLVSREADEMTAALTEISRGETAGADIWFEVNPTSMI